MPQKLSSTMEALKECIKDIYDKKGSVEFQTQTGVSFLCSYSEMVEFLDANRKNQIKVLTKLLRKSSLKYPAEYPKDNPDIDYRKTLTTTWVYVFKGTSGYHKIPIQHRRKIAGISLDKRDGHKHIPIPDTPAPRLTANDLANDSTKSKRRIMMIDKSSILGRLREHWMYTETHSVKEKLFGIEIEFCTDYRKVEKIVKYRKGACEQLCCEGDGEELEKKVTETLPPPSFRDIELIIPGVKFKTDSSVTPSIADAAEANLLAGPNGLGRLKKLCKLIRERGGFVNKTCGLHIHLDQRDVDKRVVGIRAGKLYDAIDILKDLVPDSRIKECQCKLAASHPGINHYCKITKPSFDLDKYQAINLESYRRYKTIEVRMAAGSLNPEKIWHWADFLLAISMSKNRYTNWKELLSSDFPLYLRIWAVRRANEIRPNKDLMIARMDEIAPKLNMILDSKYETEVE